jgi:hypothetical protein
MVRKNKSAARIDIEANIFWKIVKGFYPKWSSDKMTPPASEWAVSEMNVSEYIIIRLIFII